MSLRKNLRLKVAAPTVSSIDLFCSFVVFKTMIINVDDYQNERTYFMQISYLSSAVFLLEG